ANVIRERLSTASPDDLNALQWHLVKRGETLATIARKLGVSRIDLAEANYLNAFAKVDAGQKLLIPRMPSATLLARGADTPTAVTATAETAVADATPAVDDTQPDESSRIVHRVRAGETLFS